MEMEKICLSFIFEAIDIFGACGDGWLFYVVRNCIVFLLVNI